MVFKNKDDRTEYQKQYYAENKYLLRAKANDSYAKFKKKTGTTAYVSRRIANDLEENERRANEYRQKLSQSILNNNANRTETESGTNS
jgi:hypothetical protein